MNYERHAQAVKGALQQRIGTHLMKPRLLVIGNSEGGDFWVSDGNFPAKTAFYAYDSTDQDPSSHVTVLRGEYKAEDIKEGRGIKVVKESGFYVLIGFAAFQDTTFMDGADEQDNNLPVLLRQLTEIATVHPIAGSLSLSITKGLLGTDWYSGGTTSDFSTGTVQDTSASNITAPAASKAKGILIQLDAANSALEYKQSSDFEAILSLQQAYNLGSLPTADSNRYRLAYAKWVNGSSQFAYDQIWQVPELLNKGASGNIGADELILNDGSEVTIVTGAATLTKARQTVDTESDAASDDLDTINGLSEGEIAVISAEHTDRTVVVKNGTGNIACSTSADITLDATEKEVLLYGRASSVLAIPLWELGSGGSFSSFDLTADSGTPETVDDGETVDIAGGTGIDTSVAATNTVTVAIDSTVTTLTGSQTLTNKTLTTPTIGDFSNATHDHSNNANGGTLPASSIASGTLAHERGGLEADVSAYSGLIKISGGSTSQAVAGTDYTTPSSTETFTNKSITDFRLTNATELTISSGSVTATQSYHSIDTESDAASDDLATISGGSTGDRLVIFANNDARTVVVKNGTGNILTYSGDDISLDEDHKMIEFIYDGTNWREISNVATGSGGSTGSLIIAYDKQTAGTDGGASSAGTQTRDLNTLYNPDSVSGVSLSSNQLTLPSGTYEVVDISAPAYKSDRHQVEVYNATDTAILADDNSEDMYGVSVFARDDEDVVTRSHIRPTIFTLAASKALELRHYIETAKAFNGLGVEVDNSTHEVYSIFAVRKV
jgi:hypothetical protein